MQNKLGIKLTVWGDGSKKEVNGIINNIDQVTNEIRVKVNQGEVERINIKDVLEVEVFDYAVVEMSNNISFTFHKILLESHQTGEVYRMSNNISDLLGAPYGNLIESQVDKSPSEVVVSDNEGKTFYIVEREVFESSLQSLGFKIVVADGE